jgi:hypothetical protein
MSVCAVCEELDLDPKNRSRHGERLEGYNELLEKAGQGCEACSFFVKFYTVPVPGKEGRQNSLDRSFFSTLCVLMLESLRRLG